MLIRRASGVEGALSVSFQQTKKKEPHPFTNLFAKTLKIENSEINKTIFHTYALSDNNERRGHISEVAQQRIPAASK